MLSGVDHYFDTQLYQKVNDTMLCRMWLWCHTYKAMVNYVGFVEGGTTKFYNLTLFKVRSYHTTPLDM